MLTGSTLHHKVEQSTTPANPTGPKNHIYITNLTNGLDKNQFGFTHHLM